MWDKTMRKQARFMIKLMSIMQWVCCPYFDKQARFIIKT